MAAPPAIAAADTQGADVIVQSRFGVRVELELTGERLRYRIRDWSGSREFFVPYETVAMDPLPSLSISNLAFLRRLGLIPLALFIAAIVSVNNVRLSENLALAALLGMAALIAARLLNLFSVSFTLLPMSPPAQGSQGHLPRIIRDSSHDEILAKLNRRWSDRMKQIYGGIDRHNDPKKELAKFQWLKDRGVITAQELKKAAAELELDGAAESEPQQRRAIN